MNHAKNGRSVPIRLITVDKQESLEVVRPKSSSLEKHDTRRRLNRGEGKDPPLVMFQEELDPAAAKQALCVEHDNHAVASLSPTPSVPS
jgi:hypothetical protein